MSLINHLIDGFALRAILYWLMDWAVMPNLLASSCWLTPVLSMRSEIKLATARSSATTTVRGREGGEDAEEGGMNIGRTIFLTGIG